MKRSMLLLLAIVSVAVLAACGTGGATPGSVQDDDQVATIVAGTLSAIPASPPTPAVSAPPTSSASLEDFPDKVLLGEDERFSVFLINSYNADSAEKSGEIIIHDKGQNLLHEIIGTFTIFGTTIVSDDGKGDYVLLSNGTYTSRQAFVIALNDNRQAVNQFCISEGKDGSHLFWKDYAIFNNCDMIPNRPWGAGEAPSIVAINLKTGQETVIAKSDLTHHFHVQAITGDTLEYLDISVAKEEDWINQDRHNTVTQTYDLLSLEPNS